MSDLREALEWFSVYNPEVVEDEAPFMAEVLAAARAVADGKPIWWCTEHQASGGPIWCEARFRITDDCSSCPMVEGVWVAKENTE